MHSREYQRVWHKLSNVHAWVLFLYGSRSTSGD